MEETILGSTVHIITLHQVYDVMSSAAPVSSAAMDMPQWLAARYLISHNHYDETIIRLLQEGDPDDHAHDRHLQQPGCELLGQVSRPNRDHLYPQQRNHLAGFWPAGWSGHAGQALGLTSASYLTPAAGSLQPGMEVAQIDWDGKNTSLNWVTISAVGIEV